MRNCNAFDLTEYVNYFSSLLFVLGVVKLKTTSNPLCRSPHRQFKQSDHCRCSFLPSTKLMNVWFG